MAYLRFTPDEYRAVVYLCGSLDLTNTQPSFMRRLLVSSLAEPLPHLAERIARLSPGELRLLLTDLCEQPSEDSHGLTAEEVEVVAKAEGDWVAHVRFARLFQGKLVRRLRECNPRLAAKVGLLSPAQFVSLCHQVNALARDD